MSISSTQIKTILQEKFPTLAEDKADDLLAYIKGEIPKPAWMDDVAKKWPDPP